MPLMRQEQKYSRIIQNLAPGGKLVQARLLQGGISARMTALTFEHPDGRIEKVIVRQPGQQALKANPLAAEWEYNVLQLTHSLGLATPMPLFYDPSGQVFSSAYLVIEYIDGKPEFSPADPELFARQMASQQAQIHSADCAAADCSFLSETSTVLISPENRLRPVHPVFERERILEILSNAWPIPRRNAPALLHGDYWPGNILWRDSRLAAVVDWEDAQWGDPLLDFAISRLDILWIYGIDALNAFTRHYLSQVSIDTSDLPYWDLYAALRLARLVGTDLAGWADFFQPFGRRDITAQSIGALCQLFINQAIEKLL